MAELRYPNESKEYRAAREALLKEEQELVAKTKVVAAKRRALPPGGELKQDYVFQRASDQAGIQPGGGRQQPPVELPAEQRRGMQYQALVITERGQP